jgi:hypothetical protein
LARTKVGRKKDASRSRTSRDAREDFDQGFLTLIRRH